MATDSKVEVVTDTNRCKSIVKLLTDCQVIALDAEGVNLGKDGPLTLLQIGTMDGDVYLFDIWSNKELFCEGRLKDIMESTRIVKVIHSCSGDSAALFFQFGIQLQNVFDTQVAHLVIEEHKGRKLPSPAKLADICEKYSTDSHVSEHKDSLMERWTKHEGELWKNRPLTKEMIEYAAGDVTSLIPEVYETQKRILEAPGLLIRFKERVVDEVNFFIEDTVSERRRKRVDETAQSILSDFEPKYEPDTTFESIEDEDVIKAIQIIRFDKPGLSPMIKRLKTEEIKINLKKLRDQLSEEGDNFIPKSSSYGFLRAYEYNPDLQIKQEAKHLQQRINHIILIDVARKYDKNTKLYVIKQCEKEALQSLRPTKEHDDNINKVQLSLYWQMQEDDVDKTVAQFQANRRNYAIPMGKYKWLKYLRIGQVPARIKEKAKRHIGNLDEMFGKGRCPQPK